MIVPSRCQCNLLNAPVASFLARFFARDGLLGLYQLVCDITEGLARLVNGVTFSMIG
jgi:hypothetical protein